ncbi:MULTISPECIES: hypothetical protein [Paenibacillus]|uniref:hypothetical protein n=1 Tax=Paenibacillus TaxID=44249 RepID=UPI0014774B10|nr:hypothetical protein [Paenibacillus anaericanus]
MMRSEDQIKSKINELQMTMNKMKTADNQEVVDQLQIRIEMLEWVLNAPTAKYHV